MNTQSLVSAGSLFKTVVFGWGCWLGWLGNSFSALGSSNPRGIAGLTTVKARVQAESGVLAVFLNLLLIIDMVLGTMFDNFRYL